MNPDQGQNLRNPPLHLLGHLSHSFPLKPPLPLWVKTRTPTAGWSAPIPPLALPTIITQFYALFLPTSFTLFLGPGFEKSQPWLSLPFFTMSCLVLYAFFATHCSYRTPPTMGKDQNANSGLVCAHPAFGIIYYHRPLPTFDLFLLLPARHLASRLGRDSRNPDPGFLSLFYQELLLRGGPRKFCSSWKSLLLSLALWFSMPSSPFLAPKAEPPVNALIAHFQPPMGKAQTANGGLGLRPCRRRRYFFFLGQDSNRIPPPCFLRLFLKNCSFLFSAI